MVTIVFDISKFIASIGFCHLVDYVLRGTIIDNYGCTSIIILSSIIWHNNCTWPIRIIIVKVILTLTTDGDN